jgi:hypothetical protein
MKKSSSKRRLTNVCVDPVINAALRSKDDSAVQEVAVYTDGSRFSFLRFRKEGAKVVKVTGETVALLSVASGFEVSVFDDEKRWDGFVQALEYLRERDDHIFVIRSQISVGLWAVLVGSRDWEECPTSWNDLRGDKPLRK